MAEEYKKDVLINVKADTKEATPELKAVGDQINNLVKKEGIFLIIHIKIDTMKFLDLLLLIILMDYLINQQSK